MTFSELQNETGRRGLAVDRSLLFKPPICFWFRSGPAVSGTTLSMAVAMAMTLSIFCTSAPAAEAAGKSADDLTVIPIEELMNIEVSLSRTRQTVSESPSAIHVLTQEDIRRSGATSIPEALRQVPGLDVARITAHSWAVSSRGFNDFFANKLLVLMDGRSVYTPLFSGVFWDVQDTFVEDIERIEVVRGPGASLWGANAVNGVINIVTRTAHDTKGALISGLAGTEEYIGGIRYGGTISEKASYRAYVKYLHRDDQRDAMGADASDEWDMLRTGFRTDWDFSANDSITFQGDYYEGHEDQRLLVVTPPPIPFRMVEGEARLAGGNLLGSWRHTFSEESDLGVQVYYDRTERHDRVHREIRNTYDIDFQHRIALFERQEFIWGLGYRLTTDELGEGRDRTGAIQFIPSHRQDQLFSAFLQDEIAIIEDRLRLTLGSKFEHNDYTGLEIQPNARLLWTPHRNHSVWGAVSRAVRSPARFEHDVRAWFIPPPSMLVGNPEFESESLLAYELGY
ncbi:MAG: TonB-dependent receptor, partial [Verrucomicrobiota bacterium]